mgnify:CR=1 FL=1
MREHAPPVTRAWVLHPDIKSDPERRDAQMALEEAVSLAHALPGLEVVGAQIVPLPRPHPGALFGSGKIEELRAKLEAEEIDLVLVDGPVTPVQQRNLERDWKVKLLDRTGLILEIFSDRAATREVEAAARQVAAVTALVPLALADVAAALRSNLRMIRRIAEIYGGRSGFFGSWRLTRAVLSHLVATGAVAVGDDLIEPLLGGSIVAKLSRRFGEGLVNGALTARVGVAAIEVCRPLPFAREKRPGVRGIVKRALTGVFGNG